MHPFFGETRKFPEKCLGGWKIVIYFVAQSTLKMEESKETIAKNAENPQNAEQETNRNAGQETVRNAEHETAQSAGRTLDEIRDLMNRSKRSKLDITVPLLCGAFSCVAGCVADNVIKSAHPEDPASKVANMFGMHPTNLVSTLIWIGAVTLVLGVLIAFLLTLERAKRDGMELTFSTRNRRMFEAMVLPVATGGIICIAMLCAHSYEWLAPMMLCFYGLAVCNLSKYSEASLKWAGIGFIFLGIVACFNRQHGLEFWTAGFGGVHVVYGIYLLFKNRGRR